MPENDNILDRGFKNISQNGNVSGFQLDIKTGYYRGTYLSLVEGFEVTVDGETFTREQTKFMIGGHMYVLDELANLTDARWPFQETATLIISKPGGLKVGMHDVQVVQKTRVSYMPVQPSVYTFRKKIALVL
jgi:hypothetical protein